MQVDSSHEGTLGFSYSTGDEESWSGSLSAQHGFAVSKHKKLKLQTVPMCRWELSLLEAFHASCFFPILKNEM